MALGTNQRFYVSPKQRDQKDKMVVREFSEVFSKYLVLRFRQTVVFSSAFLEVVISAGAGVKAWAVQRMFWGRSSLYRSSFHFVVSLVTIIAVLSGISTRLNIISASSSLESNSGIIGRQDVIFQSGTAETIFIASANQPDYPVYKHKVEQGETLSEIAEKYGIKSSTIRWANSMSTDTIRVGQILRIPGIDGAFVQVKKGDTLERIAQRNKGNVADIIDLNSNIIDPQNPVLTEGMELFIPGGEIPLPTAAPVARTYAAAPRPATGGAVVVPSGTFINPLSNCPGYVYIRGFSAWHGGVDLAKAGGCWINAAGNGRVLRAGWGYTGEGFHVVIDHGGGVWTRYYHGTRQFGVSTGDTVTAGQSILYMGCTGYCTGTHLHFEVVVNGKRVDPEDYVRVR